MKYFLDPPPKKRRMDTNGCEHGYMHAHVLFIPAANYLDFN